MQSEKDDLQGTKDDLQGTQDKKPYQTPQLIHHGTIEQTTGLQPSGFEPDISSRRWKTNIRTLAGALEKVSRLRGVSYDWKSSGKHDLGLIAEEVGSVVPEVVAYEENGQDAKGVDYARLTALLIEAVKEQQAQIRQLHREVEELKTVQTGALTSALR